MFYSRNICPDVGQVHLTVLFLYLLSEVMSQPFNISLLIFRAEKGKRALQGFAVSGH